MDTFISAHDGIIIRHGGYGIRNSYEIWRDSKDKLYVKMNVMKNGENFKTLFDRDDLEKVLEKQKTWSLGTNGYVCMSRPNTYLHHLITDFVGTGKGFQEVSIDHINRNKLDNRKANLRQATPEQQHQNTEGKIEGTKCSRKHNAKELPYGIIQDMLPQYVNYRKEELKEYFVIDDHPMFQNGLSINGKPVGGRIKSIQAQWVNQYAESKVPYPIINKLNEIIEKCEKLNEIYKTWEQGDKINKNIKIIGDKVINDIINPRIAGNTKKVYKYDINNNLIDEYVSVVSTKDQNNCSEASIRRSIKTGDIFQGYYYRTTQI